MTRQNECRLSSRQTTPRVAKMFVAAALFLIATVACPALAANCSPNPNTFTNGTVADATQVMANFNNLLTCANSNLAHNGANTDITSLGGLTTPINSSQLSTTGVAPGTYNNAQITIGADGRITSATGGSGSLHSAVYTTAGAATFTVPVGTLPTTQFKITICSGGGGGGGAATVSGAAGAGGSSGTCFSSWFHGFTAGQTLTFSIGNFGAGGVAGSAGSNGGVTTATYASVTIMSAEAGQGGAGSIVLSLSQGGGSAGTSTTSAGASGLVLDNTTLFGGMGARQGGGIGFGASTNGYSGQGGSCLFGVGGPSTILAGFAGALALGSCSGGGGALRGTSNAAGGAGEPGVAIVEWVQ